MLVMNKDLPMTGEVFAMVYLSAMDGNEVNLVRWNSISKFFEYHSNCVWMAVSDRFFSGAKVITQKDFE